MPLVGMGPRRGLEALGTDLRLIQVLVEEEAWEASGKPWVLEPSCSGLLRNMGELNILAASNRVSEN